MHGSAAHVPGAGAPAEPAPPPPKPGASTAKALHSLHRAGDDLLTQAGTAALQSCRPGVGPAPDPRGPGGGGAAKAE